MKHYLSVLLMLLCLCPVGTFAGCSGPEGPEDPSVADPGETSSDNMTEEEIEYERNLNSGKPGK